MSSLLRLIAILITTYDYNKNCNNALSIVKYDKIAIKSRYYLINWIEYIMI